MEKKLAVIVDNNDEVTTKNEDRRMCSSACDVAENLCSSESHDTCGELCVAMSKRYVEILDFTHFLKNN